MDYWTIYLFIKLDDIRECLTQNGGLIFLCLAMAAALFLIHFLPSEEGSVEEGAKQALATKQFRLSLYALGFSIIFTIIMNIVVALLPTTGQMAAIYLGGKASQSETVGILSRLPEKYATIFETKANEWLAEQQKNLLGNGEEK